MSNRTLRAEVQLMTWDHEIKSSLMLDGAKTDDCLEAMDKILNFDVTTLMLKKHPFIVETIKRVNISR